MTKPKMAKNLVCEYCGKKYAQQSSLNKHIKKKHENEQQNSIERDNSSVEDRLNEPKTVIDEKTDILDNIDIDDLFGENKLNETYSINVNNPSPMVNNITTETEQAEYGVSINVEFLEALNDMLNEALGKQYYKISPSQKRNLRKMLSAVDFGVSDPKQALIIMLLIIYVPPTIIAVIEKGLHKKIWNSIKTKGRFKEL